MTDAHGGLRLDATVAGVGESEEEAIHNRWAVHPEVEDYLTNVLGLAPAKEPEYPCPELTVEQLTTPDSKVYTEVYAKVVGWLNFLREKKAEHEAYLLELEREMKDIETSTRETMRERSTSTTRGGTPKPPNAQLMTDTINRNPRYMELSRLELKHSAILKRLVARAESLENNRALLSRQIEIRKQDFESQGRGGPSVRSPPPGMRRPSSGGYGGSP